MADDLLPVGTRVRVAWRDRRRRAPARGAVGEIVQVLDDDPDLIPYLVTFPEWQNGRSIWVHPGDFEVVE